VYTCDDLNQFSASLSSIHVTFPRLLVGIALLLTALATVIHHHLFLPPASRVELYVGQLSSESHTAPENAQFKRLGYISLADNEQTGYRVLTIIHVL